MELKGKLQSVNWRIQEAAAALQHALFNKPPADQKQLEGELETLKAEREQVRARLLEEEAKAFDTDREDHLAWLRQTLPHLTELANALEEGLNETTRRRNGLEERRDRLAGQGLRRAALPYLPYGREFEDLRQQIELLQSQL